LRPRLDGWRIRVLEPRECYASLARDAANGLVSFNRAARW
jgi:hypothetical protein